jgi:hypothetical protein
MLYGKFHRKGGPLNPPLMKVCKSEVKCISPILGGISGVLLLSS